jgi:hypothetical protein
MTNPSHPDFRPLSSRQTIDSGPAASSAPTWLGGSERLQTVRKLLKATENNHVATESSLRAAKEMLVATERGVEAANQMMEAANAVIRVADHAQQNERDASFAPSTDSRHEEDLNTQVRRSLQPVSLPDYLPKARRPNNRFRIFVILVCLVLAASASAIVGFFLVTSPLRYANVTAKERIVDAILADSRFTEQPTERTATVTPSPGPTTTPSLKATITATTGPMPAPSPIRRLDDDEVVMLEERGHQLMRTGDVAAARLMLQRAAEAGSPRASLDLGTTYDPMTRGPLALGGIKPDAAMARAWYEKARQFGSGEAAHRLELLANQYPD